MVFQLGSTLLDACVLAVLSHGDTYGYVLTQKIKEIVNVSESTLYPVLRRLQKDGCLTAYDMAYQGRNRRYYAITPAGRSKLDFYLNEWNGFKAKLDMILYGGNQNEQG
ncbi:MAG: PadR family transcriptional regulator [Butyrivibrio sp.]